MRVEVKVHPNSKKPRVEETGSNQLEIYVKEPALEGKANEAVLEAVAKYFKLRKYQVHLVMGHKSKTKIFEINV